VVFHLERQQFLLRVKARSPAVPKRVGTSMPLA